MLNANCPHCGGAFTLADEHRARQVACPLCHAPVEVAPAAPFPAPPPIGMSGPPAYGRATASMVTGIVSIPLAVLGVGCFLCGLPGLACGIVAVALGAGVRSLARQGQVSPASGSQAWAGIVCGSVGIALAILATAVTLIVPAIMVGQLLRQGSLFPMTAPATAPSSTPTSAPAQPARPGSRPTRPRPTLPAEAPSSISTESLLSRGWR